MMMVMSENKIHSQLEDHLSGKEPNKNMCTTYIALKRKKMEKKHAH